MPGVTTAQGHVFGTSFQNHIYMRTRFLSFCLLRFIFDRSPAAALGRSMHFASSGAAYNSFNLVLPSITCIDDRCVYTWRDSHSATFSEATSMIKDRHTILLLLWLIGRLRRSIPNLVTILCRNEARPSSIHVYLGSRCGLPIMKPHSYPLLTSIMYSTPCIAARPFEGIDNLAHCKGCWISHPASTIKLHWTIASSNLEINTLCHGCVWACFCQDTKHQWWKVKINSVLQVLHGKVDWSLWEQQE